MLNGEFCETYNSKQKNIVLKFIYHESCTAMTKIFYESIFNHKSLLFFSLYSPVNDAFNRRSHNRIVSRISIFC